MSRLMTNINKNNIHSNIFVGTFSFSIFFHFYIFLKKLNCSIEMGNSSIRQKTIRIETRQNKIELKKLKLHINNIDLFQHFPTYRKTISIQDYVKSYLLCNFFAETFVENFMTGSMA